MYTTQNTVEGQLSRMKALQSSHFFGQSLALHLNKETARLKSFMKGTQITDNTTGPFRASFYPSKAAHRKKCKDIQTDLVVATGHVINFYNTPSLECSV